MFGYLLLLLTCNHFLDSINTVRILGLFPKYQDLSVHYSKFNRSTDWPSQSMAMFRAAIALADRYEIYVHDDPINYTIIQTASDDNGFAALDLVCRAIRNDFESDVVGIVGPKSSQNARFLGPFAAHVGLPLVSYAATNFELDDTLTYQTFYRTVPSDILLAEAIVQLFKYFSWTTCTMILQKDDYGYGGLKILSEVYHLNLSIQERLIYDPRIDKFHTSFNKSLETSRSRIVLVWANQSSSTRIIHHALEAHLLDGPYVWLMTSEIDLTTFKSINRSKLEGILAVVPMIGDDNVSGINKTLRTEAFDIWRNSSYDKDYFPEDLSTLSPFALYTFDAVWSLILALNKSSFDHNPPLMKQSFQCFESLLINASTYHMYLQNTQFFGVSGIVQFNKSKSNSRVNGSSYALHNVQRKTDDNGQIKHKPIYKRIMTWYETNHNWTIYDGKDRNNIVWPDDDVEKTPTDYPQLRGQHLRILVIEAPPFVIVGNSSTVSHIWSHAHNFDYINFPSEPLRTRNGNTVIYGLVVDFIRELQAQTHFNYTIDLADPSTNYHSLVALVAKDNRQYDIILSDIRITSGRLLTVDFSTPFHENTFRLITRQNPYSSLSLFSYFNPFTWDVWAAILAVIIYSSIIIYFFERQNIKVDNDNSGVRSICTGICHTLNSIIIMNADVRLTANSSRLTVLGLYGLGIILTATYTANLSSFLTLNRVQSSITGIDDIKNGRLPFSRIGIVTNSAVSDYYVQNISSTYHSLATAEDIYKRLLDHTIDASIWDSSVLEYAVNNYYCNELTVVGVGFVKSSFAVVLPKNWLYKRDLDVHILTMRETQKLESLEHMWLGHRQCVSISSDSTDNTDGSSIKTFSLDAMRGLFLSFLIITAIAFGVHLWYCRIIVVTFFGQVIKLLKKMIVKH